MTSLEDLVLALLRAMPEGAGGPEAGIRLEVDEIELAIPVESHLARDGRFLASAPRGRIATGFDPPHGALAIVLSRGAGGEA
jgi:hypothetical protein